jgi:hypothetical protein
MVVVLEGKLESLLKDAAKREGLTPQDLAVRVLNERLIASRLEPQDEWERGLFAAAKPWRVSLTDEQISSDGLYSASHVCSPSTSVTFIA